MRCQAPADPNFGYLLELWLDVSISDEMPGPCRHLKGSKGPGINEMFQSQMRCQAPADTESAAPCVQSTLVSISDEMPGPCRRAHGPCNELVEKVSISDEMPGPCRQPGSAVFHCSSYRFNLR